MRRASPYAKDLPMPTVRNQPPTPALHLASTVTGCFIPVVGVVGDVALAGVEIAKQ